jgi:hypothetical protein
MRKTRSGNILRQVLVAALAGAVMSTAMARGGGSGGGGSGGGGGGGGDTTPTSTAPVLPTTAPAPGVLMRESFGWANTLRPSGGKGTLKSYAVHTPIAGFWIEYPGSKDTAWLAAPEPQTWRVCAASTNPNEMPSPLQGTNQNGCLFSDWFSDPISANPTALMPFRAPSGPYEVSINGAAAPLANTYLGFGFTDASVLDSNLESSGTVWLRLSQSGPVNTALNYELRTDGMSGPVLASGSTFFDTFSRLVLSYDPATRMVTASVNENVLGTFPVALSSPRYIGIEGFGIADNLVVRQLP